MKAYFSLRIQGQIISHHNSIADAIARALATKAYHSILYTSCL